MNKSCNHMDGDEIRKLEAVFQKFNMSNSTSDEEIRLYNVAIISEELKQLDVQSLTFIENNEGAVEALNTIQELKERLQKNDLMNDGGLVRFLQTKLQFVQLKVKFYSEHKEFMEYAMGTINEVNIKLKKIEPVRRILESGRPLIWTDISEEHKKYFASFVEEINKLNSRMLQMESHKEMLKELNATVEGFYTSIDHNDAVAMGYCEKDIKHLREIMKLYDHLRECINFLEETCNSLSTGFNFYSEKNRAIVEPVPFCETVPPEGKEHGSKENETSSDSNKEKGMSIEQDTQPKKSNLKSRPCPEPSVCETSIDSCEEKGTGMKQDMQPKKSNLNSLPVVGPCVCENRNKEKEDSVEQEAQPKKFNLKSRHILECTFCQIIFEKKKNFKKHMVSVHNYSV